MTTKEKAEYIYEYYKIHIIAALAVVFLVGYFIQIQYSHVNDIFNITFMGSFDTSQKTSLKDDLTKLLGYSPKGKNQASVDYLPISDNDAQISSAMEQKLYVEVATSGIDLLVLNKANFDKYVKGGVLEKLDQVPGISGKTKLSKPDNPYGYNIRNNPIVKKLKLIDEDVYIGIPSSSKREASALKVLEWILAQ